MEKKYIFENGVMKLNPRYQQEQAQMGNYQAPTTVANPQQALAVVSSTTDIMQANQDTGRPVQLSDATVASMDIMQDPDLLNKFQAPHQLDGGKLLDNLTQVFSKYEVPLGLVNKLLALTEYKLNFIIDDSGSMVQDTDVVASQATEHVRRRMGNNPNGALSRWNEAEDRLHIMIEMLAYIPTEAITITFLNRHNTVVLDHTGKTPEQFAQEAHQKISEVFNQSPSGSTPIYAKLSQVLQQTNRKTMQYVFTDGLPSDGKPGSRSVKEYVRDMKELVSQRNVELNPLTFMSCTNNDAESEWMKEIEEIVPLTAELDDFEDERREVENDQGSGFPYTKGFWLICQLVAAINPHDLDALDEAKPFTKFTLDNLLGRKLTEQEYAHYFNNNRNAAPYQSQYQRFLTENKMAHEIVGASYNQPPMPQGQQGYQAPMPPQGNPGYPPMPQQSHSGFQPPYIVPGQQAPNPSVYGPSGSSMWGGQQGQPTQPGQNPGQPQYPGPQYRR